jgi:hypothetical protein
MNEVQDMGYKGWDLLGTVYQKAREQIVGAGILLVGVCGYVIHVVLRSFLRKG